MKNAVAWMIGALVAAAVSVGTRALLEPMFCARVACPLYTVPTMAAGRCVCAKELR